MVMTWLAVHPGLGDHICIAGLVADLVERGFPVTVFALQRDADSVPLLYSAVGAEVAWAASYIDAVRQSSRKAINGDFSLVLGNRAPGYYCARNELGSFDRALYAQARIPFEKKYAIGPKLAALGKGEPGVQPRFPGYVFVHDDAARGLFIDERKLPEGKRIVRLQKTPGLSIFHWREVMQSADEIHVIDSAFLNLLAVTGSEKPVYWHTYARPNGDPPHVPDWIARID